MKKLIIILGLVLFLVELYGVLFNEMCDPINFLPIAHKCFWWWVAEILEPIVIIFGVGCLAEELKAYIVRRRKEHSSL